MKKIVNKLKYFLVGCSFMMFSILLTTNWKRTKHNAHKNHDLTITRSVVTEIEYPIFNKIINKEDVIFFDAEPIIKNT